jgi:hypothetical protein
MRGWMSKNPPVRPGLIIKEALETKAMGISEMHRIYRDKVKELNALRSRADRIRGATYWSFTRQCQFARKLGLIEVDHEAPLEYPPDGEVLLSIRHGKVVPATRVIYRLTAAGRAEQNAWYNLGAAVRQQLGWG